MRQQYRRHIAALAVSMALKKEYGLMTVMFLFPFWGSAQVRLLEDSYRITLPPLPKDTVFVSNDTIPPLPPDSLFLVDELEIEPDSFFKPIIDTLPGGGIAIDYSRIPPGVFMLLALKYGPQQQSRRDFTLLNNYFKKVLPSVQGDANSHFMLGDLLRLFDAAERRKQRKTTILLQSY